MKKGAHALSFAFLCVLVLSMSFSAAGECNDGIDNDGDGQIDALVNVPYNNGQTQWFGYNDNQFWLSDHVGNVGQQKGMSFTHPAGNPLVGYVNGTGNSGWWDLNSGDPMTATLNKVCQVFGYRIMNSNTCYDYERSGRYPNGKCNYHSASNNVLYMWNTVDFVPIPAAYTHSKRWITTITCEHKLSACDDGWDNDGDGLLDMDDPDCNSPRDDSEAHTHDTDCSDIDDPSESPNLVECNDGIDNDGDSLIDYPDDPGCSSATDATETSSSLVCDDGIDNDGDGTIDAADPGCNNPTDPRETSNIQCDDGLDNDGDGDIDLADSDCSSSTDPVEGRENIQDVNFWAYPNGSKIPTRTVVGLGDYVKLMSPDNPPYEVFGPSQVHTTVTEQLWKTDVTFTNANFSSNNGEHYASNLLTVDPFSDDDPLEITIISPKCADHFNVNEEIEFEILVEDDDDIVTGEIYLGGTKIRSFTNLDGSVVSFKHKVTEPGSYSIIVKANSTRPDTFVKSSNIIVYDSFDTSEQRYVAACIDKPENFEVFSSSAVEFDASSTKGLIYTGSGTDTGGNFDWIGPGGLTLAWTFLYSNGQQVHCDGPGSLPCPGDTTPGATKYNFVKVFPTVNDNYATLTASL